MTNQQIAERLEEVARLLDARRANRFRIMAYQRAAATLRRLNEPVISIIRETGVDGLEKLPGIGTALARVILQIATTGNFPMLERMRSETTPVQAFGTVPGIGPKLAKKIHAAGIDSLDELELAAHDGRLAKLGGFGEKKLAGIRDSLAGRLRTQRYYYVLHAEEEPPIEELLEVDKEFRAIKNPHIRKGKHHYSAMFSPTPQARGLEKDNDWVMIFFGDFQYTVVTAQSGRRVVRGRELESENYYESLLDFSAPLR
jgi:DNA polymerase (family X)